MQQPPTEYMGVYATPMSFPLQFTVHTWVEIAHAGQTERYEQWAYPGLSKTANNGYIYKDLFPRHIGTTLSPFNPGDDLSKRQTGSVIIEVSGQKNSPAYELYLKIKTDALNYPYARTYNMVLGPKCNSYTTWLLQLVPSLNLSLPWYAWGRGHTPK